MKKQTVFGNIIVIIIAVSFLLVMITDINRYGSNDISDISYEYIHNSEDLSNASLPIITVNSDYNLNSNNLLENDTLQSFIQTNFTGNIEINDTIYSTNAVMRKPTNTSYSDIFSIAYIYMLKNSYEDFQLSAFCYGNHLNQTVFTLTETNQTIDDNYDIESETEYDIHFGYVIENKILTIYPTSETIELNTSISELDNYIVNIVKINDSMYCNITDKNNEICYVDFSFELNSTFNSNNFALMYASYDSYSEFNEDAYFGLYGLDYKPLLSEQEVEMILEDTNDPYTSEDIIIVFNPYFASFQVEDNTLLLNVSFHSGVYGPGGTGTLNAYLTNATLDESSGLPIPDTSTPLDMLIGSVSMAQPSSNEWILLPLSTSILLNNSDTYDNTWFVGIKGPIALCQGKLTSTPDATETDESINYFFDSGSWNLFEEDIWCNVSIYENIVDIFTPSDLCLNLEENEFDYTYFKSREFLFDTIPELATIEFISNTFNVCDTVIFNVNDEILYNPHLNYQNVSMLFDGLQNNSLTIFSITEDNNNDSIKFRIYLASNYEIQMKNFGFIVIPSIMILMPIILLVIDKKDD